MVQPRCGTDEPEHGGPIDNGPEPWATATEIEIHKAKRNSAKLHETHCARALASLVPGNPKKDAAVEVVVRAVLKAGEDHRVAMFGGTSRHGQKAIRKDCSLKNLMEAYPWEKDTVADFKTWFLANVPEGFDLAWIPAGFWQEWGY